MTTFSEIKSNFRLPLPLIHLIYDYLQNSEKKKIYNYFNLPKPIKPLIYLDNKNPFIFLTSRKNYNTGHERYYIDHKDSFQLTTQHLNILASLRDIYSFFWRCPVCQDFMPLEFKFYHSGTPLRVKGWCANYYGCYDMYNLCYCRMMELQQDAQFRGDDIKIDETFISIENEECIEDIYNSYERRKVEKTLPLKNLSSDEEDSEKEDIE